MLSKISIYFLTAFALLAIPVFTTTAFCQQKAVKSRWKEKEVDQAIAKALVYLSKKQHPNGSWAIDSYGESTASTSLAVMAFLAAGHTPDEGPYGTQITRGIRWVIDHQEPSGLLIFKTSHGPMYSHGISTLMLAEVVGMVGIKDAERTRRALEKAVRLILESQTIPKSERQRGGWRYQPASRDSDLSVTGWQLLALRAAKDVGCDVPAESIDLAVEYVKKCATKQHTGFGYQPGSGPSATRTGTGILCLEICGVHKCKETLGGADYILKSPLIYSDPYFYYGVYYCSVGMFKVGGKHWEKTRENLFPILLKQQQASGSWSSPHTSEKKLGKIYPTSLAVLALAIEYRYLPIYQR